MLLLLIAWLSIKSLVQTRNIFSVLPLLIGVALGLVFLRPHGWRFLIWSRGQRENCNQRQHTGSGGFRLLHCLE